MREIDQRSIQSVWHYRFEKTNTKNFLSSLFSRCRLLFNKERKKLGTYWLISTEKRRTIVLTCSNVFLPQVLWFALLKIFLGASYYGLNQSFLQVFKTNKGLSPPAPMKNNFKVENYIEILCFYAHLNRYAEFKKWDMHFIEKHWYVLQWLFLYNCQLDILAYWLDCLVVLFTCVCLWWEKREVKLSDICDIEGTDLMLHAQ